MTRTYDSIEVTLVTDLTPRLVIDLGVKAGTPVLESTAMGTHRHLLRFAPANPPRTEADQRHLARQLFAMTAVANAVIK